MGKTVRFGNRRKREEKKGAVAEGKKGKGGQGGRGGEGGTDQVKGSCDNSGSTQLIILTCTSVRRRGIDGN